MSADATPPSEGLVARRVWRAIGLVTVAGVIALWLQPAAWSASATTLLDGVAGSTHPLALPGRLLGQLLHDHPSAPPLRLIWAGIAGLNVVFSMLLAHRMGAGVLTWLVGPLWLLVVPDTLRVVGVEGPLLLATQSVLLAGHLAPRSPLLSAGLCAGGLASVALLSPLGLLAAGPLTVIAALFPRETTAATTAGKSTGHGIISQPIAIAWTAGVLGGLALIRLALPGDAALTWWSANMSALRVPTPRPLLGGWAELRAIGSFIAVAAFVPVVPMVLALRGGFRQIQGALMAALCWATIIALTMDTMLIDPSALVVPLVILAALPEAARWLKQRQTVDDRVVATALALALTVGAASDRLSGGDPRSTLARALHLIDDPTARMPAILRPQHIALLQDVSAPTKIFPEHAGAHQLVESLHKLKWIPAKIADWDAFAASYVLIHWPPIGPVAQAWSSTLRARQCVDDTCILTMSDGPALAKKTTKKRRKTKKKRKRKKKTPSR